MKFILILPLLVLNVRSNPVPSPSNGENMDVHLTIQKAYSFNSKDFCKSIIWQLVSQFCQFEMYRPSFDVSHPVLKWTMRAVPMLMSSGLEMFKTYGQCSGWSLDKFKRFHNQLVKESQGMKLSLPTLSLLEMVDHKISARLMTLGFLQQKNLAPTEQKTFNDLLYIRQNIVLKLPTETKVLPFYSEIGLRGTEVDERVKNLINGTGLPKNVMVSLLSFFEQIRTNSDMRNKPVKALKYLYGPAGTGKTRFVRKLAKATGLPLCEL
jgi:hypothetical protein